MAHLHAPHHKRQTSTGSSSSVNGRKVRRTYTSSSLTGRRTSAAAVSRSSSTRSRDSFASSSSSEPPRSILGPLQGNQTRRLPSRLRVFSAEDMVRPAPNAAHGVEDAVRVGSKRKRIVSGSENNLAGRLSNASRMKRQRSETSSQVSSDDDKGQPPPSEMDVDESSPHAFPSPEDSDAEFDPTDHHHLYEAEPHRLIRLRRENLVHLYHTAGLADDVEALTKSALVQAIVDAREDDITLPPSSPPGPSAASDCSSDDGNTAEDESPTRPSPRDILRRRATANQFASGSSPSKWNKSRSVSMGYLPSLEPLQASNSKQQLRRVGTSAGKRRRTSLRPADPSASLPSPPATRRRSSRALSTQSTSTTSTSSRNGKGKYVGFADVMSTTPSTNSSRSSAYRADGEDSDLSDLTDLTSSEGETNVEATPRPKHRPKASADGASRRKTPARKAKAKVGNLREESDVSTDEEFARIVSPKSSPSPPPCSVPRARKTPLKNRLRPRLGMQTHTPPSDGDDENDEVEEGVSTILEEDADIAEGDSVEAEATPKRLRSGKVVGDEVTSGDDEVTSGDDEGNEVEGDEEDQILEDDASAIVEDEDVEGAEEEVEVAEDEGEDDTENVDLTTATAKSLMRLKRDELVRMCESRDLEHEGNKSQLVDALIQWRDQPPAAAPSSTGTVRPPSTVRAPSPGRRKSNRTSKGDKIPVPILLRTHIHVHQPNTPPVSGPLTAKGPGVKEGEEGEPELDLAGLGLVDREIPCDKITKLEKIGSGGFKDVFIGKFKSRKVAIAEFRGQLTQMDIKELKLLGEFNHPNIVRFLGVSIPENTKETPVMIVSELCSNGDLFDYVRNVPPPKLTKVLNLMLDIAKGLFYLHDRKPSIIHRDCKSSNILITGRVTAKIADFGLAKVKQSTRSMVRSLVGTVNWQAPELWSPSPKYNHKVDVFSCAMVFWEMLQWHLQEKKYPWEGMNEHAIYEAVGAKRQRPSITDLKEQWCPEIVELMERMWAHEPQERPDMKDVVLEVERLVKLYK